MSRIALFTAAILIPVAAATLGQEPAPPPPPSPDEIHSIHRLLEQQSKQLDALAHEIARMSQQIDELKEERHPGGAPAPAPASAPAAALAHAEATPPEQTTAPAAKEPAPAHPAAEPPKAEPVPSPGGGLKHTVAKGETLTSIAKHYNIAVAELQKANKIQDDRKLQIGQVLNIPANKSPEPPTDKKETQ